MAEIMRSGGEPHPHPDLIIDYSGSLVTYYSPFDYINAAARIAIVGLTPGLQQMRIANQSAFQSLRAKSDWEAAFSIAKRAASFGGPMRKNLIAMLDTVHLHVWLGLETCAELFSDRNDLVHYTSVLRYPVLYNGRNYNGVPAISKTNFLLDQLWAWFASEVDLLKDCVFVPLGAHAFEAVRLVCAERGLSEDRILGGLPHPSGANAERIAYFLGRKDRGHLSPQTNANQLDAARSLLLSKVRALCSLSA
jgi:hypothetical protein